MDVITFPTTSGLSILLHGVISLPDARPYDKTVLCALLFLCAICRYHACPSVIKRNDRIFRSTYFFPILIFYRNVGI